jgi:hypothetical protein
MSLHETIAENYSKAQLEELCAKLKVRYDDLGGSTIKLQAINLQEHMRKFHRTNELLLSLRDERPGMDLNPYLYLVVSELYGSEPAMTQLFQQFSYEIMGFDGKEFLSKGSLEWRKDKAQKLQKHMEENGRSADLLQALQQKGADVSFYKQLEPESGLVVASGGATVLREYANFDIRLTPQGDGKYTADVLSAPRGQKKASDRILDLTSVETLLRFLRNKGAAPAAKVEELADILQEALLPETIMNHLEHSLTQAKGDGNDGLRVRLRFGMEQADLMKLPWEYCQGKRGYLALNTDTPFVRFLETDQADYQPIAVPNPVRVLVAIASPKGSKEYPELNVQDEVKWIKEALSGLGTRGAVELKILEHATPLELFKKVRLEYEPHIVHFIGHGDFDRNGFGALVLEDGKAEPHAQLFNTKDMLQLILGSKVKLVVLSACLTAAFDSNEALMGIAPRLVDGGLPAVVAMQFPVPDQTAVTFSQMLYETLAAGEPLDAAMTKARMGVYFTGTDRVFWGIPVLFMRAKDGVIWQKQG